MHAETRGQGQDLALTDGHPSDYKDYGEIRWNIQKIALRITWDTRNLLRRLRNNRIRKRIKDIGDMVSVGLTAVQRRAPGAGPSTAGAKASSAVSEISTFNKHN